MPEDLALPVSHLDRDAIESLGAGTRFAPFAPTVAHTGLIVVAPPRVSTDYAPIGQRAFGRFPDPQTRGPRLVWTYMADACVSEPALVGARVLTPPWGRDVRFEFRDVWVATVDLEALRSDRLRDAIGEAVRPWRGRAHSGEDPTRLYVPLGRWAERLDLHVWAPVLSQHDAIRQLGVTEEYRRLTSQALDFAILTRDRVIIAAAAKGIDHRQLAGEARLTRRRVAQILARERRRAEQRSAGLAATRAAITPDDVDELLAELRESSRNVAERRARARIAQDSRRDATLVARERGFSLQAIADLLALSKPRVQQLVAEGAAMVGPLCIGTDPSNAK